MIKLSYIKSDDRKYNVERCLSLIKSEIVAGLKDAKHVVVKPNCSYGKVKSAATSKDALEMVLKFIKPHTSNQIILAGDSENGKTMETLKDLGYLDLQERYDFTIVDLKNDPKSEIDLIDRFGSKWSAEIPNTILNSDYLISIAPPKTDDHTVYTGIIKNSLSCDYYKPSGFNLASKLGLKNKNKITHQADYKIINENIKNIYSRLSTKLAVVDAFEAMEGEGPLNGDIVPCHWAIATTTPIAADCLACTMMGINYKDVGYLSMLEKGQDEYFIAGDDWQKSIKKFKMHSTFPRMKNWE